jgi:hypothetical protein
VADTQTAARPEAEAGRRGNPYLALLLAWLVPGAGHFYLGRRGRAAAFFALVVAAVAVGSALDGRLYAFVRGQPLTLLAMLAEFGLGLAYLAARLVLAGPGSVVAPGSEYGTAFLLTAALMNLLLILDAWDIARGKKA